MIRETYAFMMACVLVCVCACVLVTQYFKMGNTDSSQTWYINAPYQEEKPYCFWWRSQVTEVTRDQSPKTLVTQYLKIGSFDKFSYIVCTCIGIGGRTLLLVVGVKGHMGHQGSNSKALVTRYLKVRSFDKFHTMVCRCILMRRSLWFLV